MNVVGGVRVDEPGADLASPSRSPPPPAASRWPTRREPLACFGEVGLTGELRSVGHADRRLAEAHKFGLSPVLGPVEREPMKGLAPQATIRAVLSAALGRQAARAA